MKTKILLLAIVFTFGSVASSLKAQEKVKADARVDLVSSYVWRGLYQTGASIQPTLAFAYSGFNLTAWGSTDFKLFKERQVHWIKEYFWTPADTGYTGIKKLQSNTKLPQNEEKGSL